MTTHELTWGDLDLSSGAPTPEGFTIEAYGSDSGFDLGNPVPIVETIQSFLQDGLLAQVTGHEGRTLSIALGISGDDGEALAAGEAALMAEVTRDGFNTLVWTPPNYAAAGVFDVVYATLEGATDDLREVLHAERAYVVTLTCLAFARSVDVVVTPALVSGAGTTATVDDCTSVTGWARGDDATSGPTVVSGAVVVSYSGVGPAATISATRSGLAVSMAATPYLVIDRSASGGNAVQAAVVNGVSLSPVATVGNERYYDCAGLTLSTIKVSAGASTSKPPLSFSLSVADISRTDTLPASGTRRQLIRTLAVAGSARTQGSLAIEHETDALGDVLAYVFHDDGSGYVPALRPFKTGGAGATTDTTLVSGAKNTLGSATVFDVPAAQVPGGHYSLMARVRRPVGSGDEAFNWTALTRIGSTDLDTGQSGSALVTALDVNWRIVDLGTLQLPTIRLADGTAGKVRITLVEADGSGNIELDEAWIFNLDTGSLSQVACGTATAAAGGPSKRLWLDSAMLTNDGLPTVLRGHSADRSDAFYAGGSITAWTPPDFEPPSMNVFTVTTNALDAAVSLRHFPRWHTHARLVA